jgi:DNA-binding NarL/FixJ family response regulator
VAAGVGGALLVTGEQGIGKSALLQEGLSGGAAAGCRVAWGAADELDLPFPLRFIGRCLAEAVAGLPGADGGPLGGDADQLLLGGRPAGDPVRAGVERVLAVVDRLCAVSPVVLVAEDLQWADEASLEVWRRLSGAVGQLPLLLAGSFRPAPAGGELEGLRQEVADGRGTVVELGPLSADEVAELAGGLLDARPGQRLAELVDRAGGNPLYLRELLDAVVRDGLLAVEDGMADVAVEPGGVPQTLAAAIADRLGGLPGEVIQVLRYAAVLGQEVSLADLGLVAGMPAAEVRRLAEQAVTAGVLAEVGIGAQAGPGERTGAGEAVLGFRHGLIRQAVYEQIPVPVRGPLHGQVARALSSAGAPTEQVAAQLAAAPWGGEWEADWLAEAAPALVYRAPQVADRLLRRAAAQLPPLDPRREVIEVGLLTTASLLNQELDRAEVERVGLPLRARTADLDRYAEVSWLVSHIVMETGQELHDSAMQARQMSEGLSVAAQALARPGVSDVWAARLRSLMVVGLIVLGQVDQAEQAALQVLDAGDRFAASWALHGLSLAAANRRDQVASLAHMERGLELLGDEPRGADLRLLMMGNRGAFLAEADRLDEAGAVVREAVAVAEQIGAYRLGWICSVAAGNHFEAGQWDDALTMLETVTVTVDIATAVQVHGISALIAAHRDDWSAVRRHLAAVSDADPSSPRLRLASYHLLLARALAAERAGDLTGAIAVLTVCLDPDIAAGMASRYLLLSSLLRLAAAGRDTEVVRAAAAAAAEEGVQPLPIAAAVADVCRGMAESDPALLLRAAEYYRTAGRPLGRAEALEEAAVVLAGRGELEEAREAFAGAAAGYQALGAAFDLRRADGRLRRLGVRRRYEGRRKAPAHGWQALTATERVIARLVAQGRSNPDIAAELVMSRSTVQTHVSHILVKLGARSRVDIVRHALPD